ncbi:MAG: hypothetical protein H7Y42_09480 [Chitinophagaceae bacterium]|nr:hypothetical protein [Chitinophagaceae bacterium]
MKVLAILFMILGVVCIFFLGVFGLLGFAMAFDAPGSADSASNWVFAIAMATGPIFISLVILVLAFLAFRKGKYNRSALIGSVFGVFVIGGFILSATSSYFAMKSFNNIRSEEVENERLYPVQRYLRQVEGGADTIIVFPNRIVAYRLDVGVEYPYAGPLGDLNETRDTLFYDDRPDTRLGKEELGQFVDEKGQTFTDVFAVR